MAGEQRHLVLPVAQEVEAVLGRGRVFYDDWYEHWIAGEDADLLLQEMYANKAELVVVCISGEYGSKSWTQTEHRAIRARLMRPDARHDRSRVLRVRVGDGDVPGVLVNELVPDFRERTAVAAAGLIVDRLNYVRGLNDDPNVGSHRWPDKPVDMTWPMADHSESRIAFAALLKDSSPARVLFVRGASETGKSYMSRQMHISAMSIPGIVCGRFDFKGTTTIGVEAFAQSLAVEPPAGDSLTERLGAIFRELRRRARPTILIFDTFEAAGEARDWVEDVLLPHAAAAAWLRVVILGQTVPNRAGMTWEAVAAKAITLRVPEPEHWLEYGRRNRGDEVELGFIIQAHRLTDGKASILAGLLGPKS